MGVEDLASPFSGPQKTCPRRTVGLLNETNVSLLLSQLAVDNPPLNGTTQLCNIRRLEVVSLGDFNIDWLKSNEYKTKMLSSLTKKWNLSQFL